VVEKRAVGTSGMAVAPLALGGNVFGWTTDEPTSFAILDAFVDAGGTMIDTADIYSAWVSGHQGGESEALIGRWLNRDPSKRDKVVIASKVGLMNGLAPDVIRAACETSLKRLGIDAIDLYYQHKDDESVPLADSLSEMDSLVKSGKVRALGLSQFTPERFDEAMTTAREGHLTMPCALQPWYNLVERDRLEGRMLDVAMRHGMAVFPFFSLANGFLTGKYRSKDDLGKSVRGNRVVDYLEGKGMRVLAALDQVAEETGAALATIALAWTMAQPGITAPIASATSVEQLQQLTAALHLKLSPEQIARLTAASAETEAVSA
jgi:aryl-alcohol dehydrogenase-like predicted oxidoreductase